MSQHPNHLLARLSERTFAAVQPHLKVKQLCKGECVAEPGQKMAQAFFPHSGVLSFVVDLPGGGGAETGVVGRDGAFGGLQSLDHGQSLNRVNIQIAGEASVMPLPDLKRLLLDNEEFRKTVISYKLYAFARTQQHVACNAHHTVQQRLCKWLVRMHDLAGSELPLTQEFISIMIGVRRTSVSDAAKALHQDGMIEYSRGLIRVKSKQRLEDAACECVEHIRGHYKQAFHPYNET